MRLELRDIHFRRDATEILRGVDLQLKAGDIGVLVGPSGCGKTTTLRCIAGLESITSGEIRIGDRVVSSVDRCLGAEVRRVGYVLQDNALFPHLTVADNIRFGLRKLSRDERETRVADMLALLGLRGLERRWSTTTRSDRPIARAATRPSADGRTVLESRCTTANGTCRRTARLAQETGYHDLDRDP